MQDAIDLLGEAIAERRLILFAGAGVSMCVGLPSWSELMDHLKGELGLSSDLSPVSYQTLAEYYRIKHGSIGPLRSWLDRRWSVSEELVRQSPVHRLLVELDFPTVYTTNFDNNLEVAYRMHGRNFVKISNPSDLVKSSFGTSEIIKFHGDFDDDQSLVMAETDYFKRLTFDTPLDLRLKSDALSRPVLFIGYSVSDLNIRLLLYRLWRIWKESGRERDRPQSYVFSPKHHPIQEAVLGQWGVRMLSDGDGTDPAKSLQRFLERLEAAGTGDGDERTESNRRGLPLDPLS